MAPSRAYIPSRTLLRALSRPLPPRCPFARPLTAQFVRGKRTRTKKLDGDELNPKMPGMPGLRFPTTIEEAEKITGPLPENQLNDPDIPVISWYEQDLDSAVPERLVQRIATPEDRRKHNELSKMLDEDDRYSDYDDAELNRRLMDGLISDPNFADLTEELKALKADIMSREEVAALRKEQEPELKELDASLKMATHESIQDLINDPDLADARSVLEDLQAHIPDSDEKESPEFEAALRKVEEQLSKSTAFQKKLAAMEAQGEGQATELGDMEKEVQELEEYDENAPVKSPEDLDKLLVQMKDLMHAMGGDKQVEADLDAIIKEDPLVETEGDIERELNFTELSDELTKLAGSSKSAKGSQMTAANGERVDPELEAKVDRIMQDPKLMEKLMYIHNLVVEEQIKSRDISNIDHETAPDPQTLDASRTTEIQQRMELARKDPEHIAALRRLRVNLLPPFNISPALKSFNQAIELAYLGANDDIRRILWRTYLKARTLPTFLQNISGDAWDILYYSQAVTWGSNQNRQNHLQLLLQDLSSVGRNGPPTHPSTFIRSEGAGHLDA